MFFLPICLILLSPTPINGSPTWGTYRPHALISTRANVPHSPYFGFLYHPANDIQIRHLASDHQDKIRSYSYKRHDGRYFGEQEIYDIGLNLIITSVFQHHPTESNAWSLRVSAQPLDVSKSVTPVSLVFYAAAGPDDIAPGTASANADPQQWGSIKLATSGVSDDVVLTGEAASIGGAFRVALKQPKYGSVSDLIISTSSEQPSASGGTGSRSRLRNLADKPVVQQLPLDTFHVASSPADEKNVWAVEQSLTRLLRRSQTAKKDINSRLYLLDDDVRPKAPGLFVQRILEAPFEIEMTFVETVGRSAKDVERVDKELSDVQLDLLMENSRAAFDERFEHIFQLQRRGIGRAEIDFAKVALSNVLGGIGYFYGSSIVQSSTSKTSNDKMPIEFLEPVGLLTATPSRSSFPRGFLWDEGFHQLIVQRWDPELSRQCMLSWMSAIQGNGWIPREQILGMEARNRFPAHVQHLMVQNPVVANPPTILMPLRVLASISLGSGPLNESESGKCDGSGHEKSSCSTQGSTQKKFSEVILENAKQYYTWLKRTQSGSKSNSFRWRGRSPNIKAPDGYPLTLASGLDDFPRAERASTEERHVDLHCWMTWAAATLAKITENAGQDATAFWNEYDDLRASLVDMHGDSGSGDSRENLLLCDYDGDDKICHEGYPTILPLALGLLKASDNRLGAILDSLEDPSLLKARAGVRSLSKSDVWHRKGDDYWTGSVWMPFNFLTLASLKAKYATEDGPHRERSEKIFTDLHKSILENAYQVYAKTGQLWENYSPDDDGAGKSGRQFTGWSALVLLMYANMFDGVT